jgi:O-antigen/teichoic acid export membrane protein
VNPLKQLAGQTIIYGLSNIVPKFLNYLLVFLYTRVFEPSQYGVVVEFYAYVTFLNIILTYGLETGYFRFATTHSENKVFGTCFTSLIVSSLLFILSIVLFSQNIANGLGYHHHPEYIIWFAIILGIDAILAIPYVKLRLENRPRKFAFFKIVNVTLNIGLTLLFLVVLPVVHKHHHLPLWIYNKEIGVGYVFLANLVANICLLLLIIPPYLKRKLKFDKKLWREIFLYSFPLLIAGLTGNMNEASDRIMMKFLLPSSFNSLRELGIFGANAKIAVLMTLYIQMFRFAAEPFFFNKEKEKDSRDLFAMVTKYFIVFGMIIFTGVLLYLNVVKYFIGHKYWEGLKVVPVMLLANLLLGIYFNLSMWYKLTGKTHFGIYIAIIGASITLLINVLFVPVYSYMACAWAHLLCYSAMIVASYILSLKYYPIKYDFYSLSYMCILTIASILPGILLSHILGRPVIVVLNTVIFLGYLYFVNKRMHLFSIFVRKS